jgi:putative two-component system response regulator
MNAETPRGAAPMNARVLIVDQDSVFAHGLARLIHDHGHQADVVVDGQAALVAIAAQSRDVILVDVTVSDVDGLEICRRLKREWRTRLIPVVLMHPQPERELRIQGFDAGADDFVSKTADQQELLARLRALVRMKRSTDDLDSAASILMSLAELIEGRDGYAEGHCHRMANYATALGRRLGLGEEPLQALHRGGFLHDIGMLAIPEAVLRKTDALEPDEYALVKSHTTVGESLCASLRSLTTVRPIIRSHHERLDGSGYPDGLRGDAIPLLAQIMGLVDVYEGVTTQRPYRNAHSVEEAIDILLGQTARGWRRQDLVQEFVAIVESRGFETFNLTSQ